MPSSRTRFKRAIVCSVPERVFRTEEIDLHIKSTEDLLTLAGRALPKDPKKVVILAILLRSHINLMRDVLDGKNPTTEYDQPVAELVRDTEDGPAWPDVS